MSGDDTVLILVTPKRNRKEKEHRVRWIQAAENIDKGDEELVRYFGETPVLASMPEAEAEAKRIDADLAKKHITPEYGMTIKELRTPFPQ